MEKLDLEPIFDNIVDGMVQNYNYCMFEVVKDLKGYSLHRVSFNNSIWMNFRHDSEGPGLAGFDNFSFIIPDEYRHLIPDWAKDYENYSKFSSDISSQLWSMSDRLLEATRKRVIKGNKD